MKKLFTIITVVSITLISHAQLPQKMSYQAVIRNSSNVLITGQLVGMRVSILQGSAIGTPVYVETQTTTTNANGLVTIEIGGGFPITGTFSSINWESGPYFLKTETDPTGGTNYTIFGTSQLLSVPYALYTKTAGTANYNSLSNLPTLNIANWNTAYGWGNHAGLYRPIAWVPDWSDVTGKPGFATVATSGSYNDLSNKPTIPNSQWTTSGSNIYYNTGGVGIGTNNPGGILELFTNSSISYPHLLLTESEGDYSRLMFKNTDAPTKSWAIAGRSNSTNGDSRLNFWYSNGLSGENIMSITGDGTVGIGTTDPGTLLHIHSNTTYAYSFTPIIRISDNFKAWNIGLGDSDDRFSIATNDDAERFTIMNSSGYVGIGTKAPAAGLHLKASAWPGSFIYLESSTGGDAGFRLYEGSAVRWHIYNNSIAGGLHIENNALATAVFIQQSSSNVGVGTTTPFYKLQVGNAGDGTQARANAWNILSDARLKKNFTKLINPLEMVRKLNGYYFYWNSGIDESRQVGFSAQQVSEVIPEVVSKGDDGYLSLEYSKMVPLLVEAIKAQQNQIDELKKEITLLKSK
jgi:hypothetical protein